ncbi:hypothetical protein B0H11DRAFT_2196885 [Mycena galericulata]|nr:hypothetical protein B0H11DRAFT_2196885 [Mycena galericulata]
MDLGNIDSFHEPGWTSTQSGQVNSCKFGLPTQPLWLHSLHTRHLMLQLVHIDANVLTGIAATALKDVVQTDHFVESGTNFQRGRCIMGCDCAIGREHDSLLYEEEEICSVDLAVDVESRSLEREGEESGWINRWKERIEGRRENRIEEMQVMEEIHSDVVGVYPCRLKGGEYNINGIMWIELSPEIELRAIIFHDTEGGIDIAERDRLQESQTGCRTSDGGYHPKFGRYIGPDIREDMPLARGVHSTGMREKRNEDGGDELKATSSAVRKKMREQHRVRAVSASVQKRVCPLPEPTWPDPAIGGVHPVAALSVSRTTRRRAIL